MSRLSENTRYDPFGSTIGGSSEFGGINEAGGLGSRILSENSNTTNPDGSINEPVNPKPHLFMYILGFFALKEFGLI